MSRKETFSPVYKIIFSEKQNDTIPSNSAHGQLKCEKLKFPFKRSDVLEVPIIHAETLIPAQENPEVKEITELTLDIKKFGYIDVLAGNTIAILPQNSEEEVNELLLLLGLADQAKTSCHIEVNPSQGGKSKKKVPKLLDYIPTPTTPYEILRDCLNIRGILTKKFLKALISVTGLLSEIEYLESLCSKQSDQQYYNTTLLDLLRRCPTCKPQLEMIIEHLPRLLPRPYSVTNSTLDRDYKLSFIYSIRSKNPGVTTSMLHSLKEKKKEERNIVIYFRDVTDFAYDHYINQVLVCVGTGIAPFLAFLQYKDEVSKVMETTCQTWLFVGTHTHDTLIYSEFLNELKANGVLNRISDSYSRESDAQYHYVYEQIRANSAELAELFFRTDTKFYISADGAEKARSIEEAFKYCLQKEFDFNSVQAVELMKTFRETGKYIEETWV